MKAIKSLLRDLEAGEIALLLALVGCAALVLWQVFSQ